MLLGPLYTERSASMQSHAPITLATWLTLKSMETNGVAPERGCNLFWSDSILVNETHVASVITALMLTLGVNGPLGKNATTNCHCKVSLQIVTTI